MPELEIYLHIIVIYYIHIFYKDEKWGYDGDVMNVINVCKTDNQDDFFYSGQKMVKLQFSLTVLPHWNDGQFLGSILRFPSPILGNCLGVVDPWCKHPAKDE